MSMELKITYCEPTSDGYKYELAGVSPCRYDIGTTVGRIGVCSKLTQKAIIEGIERVFGFDRTELLNGPADIVHTQARKTYARLRTEMGLSAGEISRELHKPLASVVNYLKDKSIKVAEYCDAVRNG